MARNKLPSESVELLLAYKRGEINLADATVLFSSMTGLSTRISEKFLKGLKRENVVRLAQTGARDR